MCTAMVGQARGQGVWGLSPSRKGAQTQGNPQGAGSREQGGPQPQARLVLAKARGNSAMLEIPCGVSKLWAHRSRRSDGYRAGAPAGREAVHGHMLHRAEKGALEACSMAQRS